MGLHSVEAQMDPENAASRRLLESSDSARRYFRENYYDPVKARTIRGRSFPC
jgi:RimJ/RimL family protein N-acetyltransferase